MINTDEDALICDFAETYHILDYRSLPLSRVAVLACGLRPDSRIMTAMSGVKLPAELMMLTAAVDLLSYLVWLHTKDSVEGINRPKSILASILHPDEEDRGDGELFASPADFEAARRRILEGI